MTSPVAGSSAAASAALQAQIAHYRKTLSECQSCDSARTPEGKRNIDDLSQKIREAESTAKSADSSSAPDTIGAVTPSADVRETPLYTESGRENSSASERTSITGREIDLFA